MAFETCTSLIRHPIVVRESAVWRTSTPALWKAFIIRDITPGTPVIRSPIAVTLQHPSRSVYS